MNMYRFEIEGTFKSLHDVDGLKNRLVIALAGGDGRGDLLGSLEGFENDSVEVEKLTLVPICPHDGSPLEYRMFDIDGTSLEEHAVCLKCRYGAPSLR